MSLSTAAAAFSSNPVWIPVGPQSLLDIRKDHQNGIKKISDPRNHTRETTPFSSSVGLHACNSGSDRYATDHSFLTSYGVYRSSSIDFDR
ncbi:hypothetical protein PM082_023751 [Marasmius tenuissimus]|nr:hypothetical protein PM082_023751 [Marasmius tenuissimus]